MTAPSAYNCPGIYFDLGIDLHRLGIVMLKVNNIPDVTEAIEAFACTPYVSPDPDSHVDGAVGEQSAHITVLYGLLEKDPALARRMLADWQPEAVTIDRIEIFPYEGYACVVAAVVVADNLLEARSRLSLLPHIDLFPEYKPHITIAYVKGDDAQIKKFADNFNYLVGTTLKIKHVDYGQ